jgi:hypothetical protein
MQIQRLGVNSFVQTIRGSFVQQIELAKDAMRVEEVVKLFSAAFEQACALKEVDKPVLGSLTQELTITEMTVQLEKQKRLPKAVLSDHDGQFKEQWKEWCRVEVYFARPSHSRDKDEVERRVQNLNGSSSITVGEFLEWLKGKLGEYKGVV